MKKLSLLIMPALLAAALVILPSAARAQDNAQAEFERTWYDVCYTKKDKTKCYQLSKELLEKYPNSNYAKNAKTNVDQQDLADLWEKFQAALKAYYDGPDAAKLERLFSTGDDFLAKSTTFHHYVVAQQALAGASAVIGEIYKDKDKAKGYVEKALRLFDPSAPLPSDDEEKKHVAQFRDEVIALGNQYLGYYVIQTKGDPQQALAYLGKSIAVKTKQNIGWKDPNNYYLRSQIYNDEYNKLSAEYKAMTDDQKTGDAGKELLKKINVVVDKLIADYARMIAVATSPAQKSMQDFGRESFNSLWNYRTGAPEKAAAYLKSYEADPTVADVAVPAKVETAETAMPSGPPTTGGNVKMAAGGGGAPGSTPTTNGTKTTATKKAAATTTKKPVRKKR
jgi:hypothetical protein